MNDQVTILGCRGSVPVSGAAFSRYGGATSCVYVQLGGQAVVLDAGTGILTLPMVLDAGVTQVPVLISHPHVDHLMGLPMCPGVLQPGLSFHIYAAPRQGLGPEQQLKALMAPPLWPVGPEALPAEIAFHPLPQSFSLGAVRVDCMEGMHPGGITLFRLSSGEKSIVYIPDCTLDADMTARAAEFARGCNLLLCDGQYFPEEWDSCRSFGHSTWEMAAELGVLCGAEKTRILHHDPGHTDSQLDQATKAAAQIHPGCTLAYEGEVIPL